MHVPAPAHLTKIWELEAFIVRSVDHRRHCHVRRAAIEQVETSQH